MSWIDCLVSEEAAVRAVAALRILDVRFAHLLMDPLWPGTFRARMRHFESRRPPQPNEVSVSIKVRVVSGCFDREHSRHAYALIDQDLISLSPLETEFAFEEHESGPEVLLYVAAGAALAKSIIDLVATIIRARSEGVKRGDSPSHPIELVVRRTVGGDAVQEELVLRFDHTDPVSAKVIGERLGEALDKLVGTTTKKPGRAPRKRR